jgi:hypothetical protein
MRQKLTSSGSVRDNDTHIPNIGDSDSDSDNYYSGNIHIDNNSRESVSYKSLNSPTAGSQVQTITVSLIDTELGDNYADKKIDDNYYVVEYDSDA